MSYSLDSAEKLKNAALILRIGLGAVFVIGGLAKLSQLLGQATHDAIVTTYLSPAGYINAFFQEWLFAGVLGRIIDPSAFLVALSSFELISGIALIVGLLVRPIAFIYAFLLWAFVIALPTLTVPGIGIADKTYLAPAILVQIRDISLSGLMFALFCLGAGKYSVDDLRFSNAPAGDWNSLGLLLRISLAFTLLVGGFFGGNQDIASFAAAHWLLIVCGFAVLFGTQSMGRAFALAVAVILLWFMLGKITMEKSLLANLNGFKREIGLLAAALVMAYLGGGERFTIADMWRRSSLYFRPGLPR